MEARENFHWKLMLHERNELIELGKKSGTIHEKDLRALFFDTPMTEEEWPDEFERMERRGLRVIGKKEGGSIFYPEPDELKESFREDTAAMEYILELERNGIEHCLTPEQEAQLAIRRNRVEKAEELLVEGNLLRVISVARQYCGQGLIPLDLFSEGNRALTDAVKMWSLDVGCPMTLYLIHHIRRGIRGALISMTDRPPRISVEVLERVRKLQAEETEEEAIRSRQRSRLPVVGENAILYLMKQRLVDNPEMVTPRELEVLRRRLGLADGEIHPLEEVAEHFGITRERVRQIENKFLRRSRTYRKRIRNFYE